MYIIERKNIENKRYFYLSKRLKVGKKYKKIQVYIGKLVPKNINLYLKRLRVKELALIPEIARAMKLPDQQISLNEYESVEKARVDWNYYGASLSPAASERWWRAFAIRFIFESNAIEGSKLSAKEVEAIVRRQYVGKSLERKEVREVENATEAFARAFSDNFHLNQRSIIALHALITRELGVSRGFKKRDIVVNNKATTPPGEVRGELARLIVWWRQAKKECPFYAAIIFHQRFERIHPFEDGNGRVGRLILAWMLRQAGYGAILFRNSNRRAYFSALSKADGGIPRPWLRYAMRVYKDTIADIVRD